MNISSEDSEKWVKLSFEDDSAVERFDFNALIASKKINEGDLVNFRIGENVLFVKDMMRRVLSGPFKLLSKMKFTLSDGMEFDVKYMTEGFIQITLCSDITEDVFQLAEELFDFLKTQAASNILANNQNIIANGQQFGCRQLELVYCCEVNQQYNMLLLSELQDKCCEKLLLSVIFKAGCNISEEQRVKICQSLSILKQDYLSVFMSTMGSESELLELLKISMSSGLKGCYIQSQNLVLIRKQIDLLAKKNIDKKIKDEILPAFKHDNVLQINFQDPDILQNQQMMKELHIFVRASDDLTIKFSSVLSIQKCLHGILASISNKTIKNLKLDAPTLALSFTLADKKLLLHFKEPESNSNQKISVIFDTNYSFCLVFIDHFRPISTNLHVILENISFRHTNKLLYSQIVNAGRVSHRITHFTLEAPLDIIRQDFQLAALTDHRIHSIKLIALRKVNKSNSAHRDNIGISKHNKNSSIFHSTKKDKLHLHQMRILQNFEKPKNAMNRYRQLQHEYFVSELEFQEQTYHLVHLIQILGELKQQQREFSKEIRINNYLSLKAAKQRGEQLFFNYQGLVARQKELLQAHTQDTLSTSIFEYEHTFQKIHQQANVGGNCNKQGNTKLDLIKKQDNLQKQTDLSQKSTIITEEYSNQEAAIPEIHEHKQVEDKQQEKRGFSNNGISQNQDIKNNQILTKSARVISLQIDMKENYPELLKEIIQTPSFLKIHELQIRLPKDLRDTLAMHVLKYFSNSKIMTNLTVKCSCDRIADNSSIIQRFISSNLNSLQSLKVIIEGKVFLGNVQREEIKNICDILPFQARQKNLNKLYLQFKSLDSIQNTSNMIESLKKANNTQHFKIETSNLKIEKDSQNSFKLSIDTSRQTFNAINNTDNANQDLFLSFIYLQHVFTDLKFTFVDITLTELQYPSLFKFISAYPGQIQYLEILFLNLCKDQYKLSTAQEFRNILSSHQSFENLKLRFRDNLSKEDAFSVNWRKSKSHLRLYLQGNQIYSNDYNFDRLVQASIEEFSGLVSTNLSSLSLEFFFDSETRANTCISALRVLQGSIYQNKTNLYNFSAVIKLIDEHGRMHSYRMFDEIVRAVRTKRQLIQKFVLLERGMMNSHLEIKFRREILWDTISLITLGTLQNNLIPVLEKRFLVRKEQPIEKQDQDNDEEGFNIGALFQQERDRLGDNQTALGNGLQENSVFAQKNSLSRENSRVKRDENNEEDILEIEFI